MRPDNTIPMYNGEPLENQGENSSYKDITNNTARESHNLGNTTIVDSTNNSGPFATWETLSDLQRTTLLQEQLQILQGELHPQNDLLGQEGEIIEPREVSYQTKLDNRDDLNNEEKAALALQEIKLLEAEGIDHIYIETISTNFIDFMSDKLSSFNSSRLGNERKTWSRKDTFIEDSGKYLSSLPDDKDREALQTISNTQLSREILRKYNKLQEIKKNTESGESELNYTSTKNKILELQTEINELKNVLIPEITTYINRSLGVVSRIRNHTAYFEGKGEGDYSNLIESKVHNILSDFGAEEGMDMYTLSLKNLLDLRNELMESGLKRDIRKSTEQRDKISVSQTLTEIDELFDQTTTISSRENRLEMDALHIQYQKIKNEYNIETIEKDNLGYYYDMSDWSAGNVGSLMREIAEYDIPYKATQLLNNNGE